VAVLFVAYATLGSRAALLCTILLLFNGLLMSYSGTLLPEPLLTLFSFLAVWLFRRGIDFEGSAGLRLAACAGALCGLAYSVKDTGILVAPALVGYLGLFHPRSVRFPRAFTLSACCFAGLVAVIFLEWF